MDNTNYDFELNTPVFSADSPASSGEAAPLSDKPLCVIEGSNNSLAEIQDALELPVEAAKEEPLHISSVPDGAEEVSLDGKTSGKRGLLKSVSFISGILLCIFSILFDMAGVIGAVDKYILEYGKDIVFSEIGSGALAVSTEASKSPSTNVNEPSPNPPISKPTVTESYPIEEYDLSAGKDALFTLSNQTAFTPDTPSLRKKGNPNPTLREIYKKYGDDAPVVLIVHTHGTEGFSDGTDTYTKETPFRTDSTENNVVALGAEMKKVFEKAGINTIHCTEMFDIESYKDSYSKSFSAVSSYIAEYPSIAYVFDVHRDSIIKNDLTKLRPLFTYNGEKAAQVMMVVGTNEGGADHDNWEKNLSLALSVQERLYNISSSLPRKINLRSAAFNQGLSNGSLLLEIGSCGNTLDEAKRSAAFMAYALSEVITEDTLDFSADDY